MSYDLIRLLHLLGSAVLFGTGLGIAFFLVMAIRSGDTAAARFAARWTVRADYVFTLPMVVLQPVTGAALVWIVGYDWADPWLVASIALYGFVGACWIPVVFLQHGMARSLERGATVEEIATGRAYRAWFLLGWPGFLGVLAIFWLMITKPMG